MNLLTIIIKDSQAYPTRDIIIKELKQIIQASRRPVVKVMPLGGSGSNNNTQNLGEQSEDSIDVHKFKRMQSKARFTRTQPSSVIEVLDTKAYKNKRPTLSQNNESDSGSDGMNQGGKDLPRAIEDLMKLQIPQDSMSSSSNPTENERSRQEQEDHKIPNLVIQSCSKNNTSREAIQQIRRARSSSAD